MNMSGEAFAELAQQIEDWLDPQPPPSPTLSLMEHAVEAERAKLSGHQLGLADKQTAEVIGAWVEFFQGSPWPVSWPDVRRALIARAMNEEWRPPWNKGRRA